MWENVFAQAGGARREPTLVLLPGAMSTPLWQAQAAMGPFYCPAEQKIYTALGFYKTLKTRSGAPGDFAQTYVIAHEGGHHVQNLLGTSARMDRMRGRASQSEVNALGVRMELQAGFLPVYGRIMSKQRGSYSNKAISRKP